MIGVICFIVYSVFVKERETSCISPYLNTRSLPDALPVWWRKGRALTLGENAKRCPRQGQAPGPAAAPYLRDDSGQLLMPSSGYSGQKRSSPVASGTAFDIAGQGVADASSLLEAVRMAQRLSAPAQG